MHMSIGPKTMLEILKNSATNAPGIEIIITNTNSLENITLKIFFIKGYSLVILHHS